MDAMDDLLNSIGNAKPPDQYGSKILPGKHTLALKKFYGKKSYKQGYMFAADFSVLESTAHQKYEEVAAAFFVSAPEPGGSLQQGKLKLFVMRLLDQKDPAKIAKMLKWLQSDPQPGCGIKVNLVAVQKTSEKGKAFTDWTWEFIPGQTAETIAATKKEIMNAAPPVAASIPAPTASQDVVGLFDVSDSSSVVDINEDFIPF